jgi:hypothetical protein
MSGPFVACLFVVSLSYLPEQCIIQPPRPVAFAERWRPWSTRCTQSGAWGIKGSVSPAGRGPQAIAKTGMA